MTRYFELSTTEQRIQFGNKPEDQANVVVQLSTDCITTGKRILVRPFDENKHRTRTGRTCEDCKNKQHCNIKKKDFRFYAVFESETKKVTKAKALALLI